MEQQGKAYRRGHSRILNELTKREIVAINLFATGKKRSDIALGLKTTSNNLQIIENSIMCKLGACTMAEAICKWDTNPQNHKNNQADDMELPVELGTYLYAVSSVRAMRYTGREMDALLLKRYPNDLRMEYGTFGAPMLCTHRHGLKDPFSGDWLVFDNTGRTLTDVMEDGVFKKTFREEKRDEHE